MPVAPPLQPGSVVWAEAPDKNGYVKDRPMVVLAIAASGINFVCCAITTRNDDPRPSSYVSLPWEPNGRVATGLRRECWAVATWIIRVRSIRRIAGYVSKEKLQEIVDKLPTK